MRTIPSPTETSSGARTQTRHDINTFLSDVMYIISKRTPRVAVESSTVLHSPELQSVLHSASLRLSSPQFPSVMAFSSHLQRLHSSRDYAAHGPTIFFRWKRNPIPERVAMCQCVRLSRSDPQTNPAYPRQPFSWSASLIQSIVTLTVVYALINGRDIRASS